MLRKPHDRMFRKAQMKLFSMIVSILLAVFIALIGSINVITKEVMRGQSKEVLMQIAAGIEYNDKNSTFTYTKPAEPKNERHEKADVPPPKPAESQAKPTTTETATTSSSADPTTKQAETTGAVPSTDENTESVEQNTPDEPEYHEEHHEEAQPAETQAPETQAPETQAPSSTEEFDWNAWWQQQQQQQPQDWSNWNQQDWEKYWNDYWNNNGGQQNWNNWGQQQGGNNNNGDPNNPWNPWNPWNPTNPWNPWNNMNPWNPWTQWNTGDSGTPKMYSKEPDNKKGVKVYENEQSYKRYSDGEDAQEQDEENDDELIAESQSFGADGGYTLTNTVYNGDTVLDGFTVLSNSEKTAPSTAEASKAEPAPMSYSRVEPIPKTLGYIDYFVLMADTKGEYLDTLYNDKISSENAQKYITAILENGDDTDMINSYQFYKEDKSNGTIIVLTDKSYEMEMLGQLKRTTVIIGSIALVILSVLAYFLSKRSIQPIKVAFDKQKQFVSDASHELKTPLTVISTNADVLSGEIGPNRWLDYIKAQTDRMSVLVNDLLNLTRLENNTTDIERKYFNLSKAIINTALPFECQAFESNKKFEVNVEDDIMLSGSEKHIKQMAAIFIDNALKYSNDGGTVRVALKRVGDRKLFSVYNTGEGIKEEDTEKIFERFYRSDASRNRSTGGYGLGLAIAKSVIDKHKFKIHVMNQPGKSVCFMVTMQ
ncbi:sensor histidine kinase [Ruminococcus flavefaciens]|uniref:sensor histidine kinase n=1 Tax=Ruminococcus flavefaciens TaxID=1265 RepID=UPI0009B890A4|nr:HAMP domain-containing sensor histidine kinase [Ruminococcus flavefaciens]